MQRVDQQKTIHQTWEANYNAPGRQTIDASTTEFSGTRREADLVIRGLKALRAQLIANEAAGVETKDESIWDPANLGKAPRLREVEELLGEIAKPSYQTDPITEAQHL